MIGLRTKSGDAYLFLITEQPNCKSEFGISSSLSPLFLLSRTTQCLQVVCGNDTLFLNHNFTNHSQKEGEGSSATESINTVFGFPPSLSPLTLN